MPWASEEERVLLADRCKNSFWDFCDYALGYGREDWTWWTERVHRPFCNWFEAHVKDWEANRRQPDGSPRSKHLMICVHREFGKTMIITKAGLLWIHLRNPDISTYIGSSTVTRAGLFFNPLKEVLAGNDPDSRFTWLYGNWYDPDRTWSAESFTHAARVNMARTEPSVGTWGVETGLVGMHPDVGFLDDPIDYEKMASDATWLGKVNTHVASLSPVFRADSLFVYTGTRYHDADFIGEALRLEGAKTITGMPMAQVRESPDGKWHVYFRAARDAEGNPTFVENWPDDRLRAYERQHSLQYAAQLMNDPNTGAHVALTEAQVDQLWVDSKDVPKNLRHSLHVDTAFKRRESTARGDYTVIVHMGHARDGSGEVYMLGAYGSNRWRVEDFNNQLVTLLQRLRSARQWPFVLTDEAEMGGKYGTWELTIQTWCHGSGIPAPQIKLLNRGGKKKVTRLIEAASYWVDGKMKLVRGANGVDQLVEQMLRIGTSVHDDYADAAADVFHKEVYVAARQAGWRDPDPKPQRPYDDLLQSRDSRVEYIRSKDKSDTFGLPLDFTGEEGLYDLRSW